MEFSQGDTVVHPLHGAAEVAAIFTRDLGQGPVQYLKLTANLAALTILVPVASAAQIGIRALSSRQEAEAVLSVLTEDIDVPLTWAERNPSTVARMNSHRLDQIAMVVRDLTRHRQRTEKPLNPGEKSALDKCLSLLARELSLSLEMSEEETKELLEERCTTSASRSGDAFEL